MAGEGVFDLERAAKTVDIVLRVRTSDTVPPRAGLPVAGLRFGGLRVAIFSVGSRHLFVPTQEFLSLMQ